jgi:PST family polysaccharide transporter
MAAFYLVITRAIAEFGIGSAVVQMRELDRDALSQLHSVGVLLAAVAYCVCVLTSPMVAWFFQFEGLWLVVTVLSLMVLLTGFQIVPLGILRRNLDYRLLATAEALEAIVRAVLIVVFAYFGLSYWSVILGGLTATAMSTILLNRWARVSFGRPQWQTVKRPLHFGGQLTVGALTSTLTNQSDGIVVARMFGESLLGQYQMAMQIGSAPAQKVSELLFRVTGPLFANLQNDKELLRRYYLNLIEVLMLIILPLTVGLGAVAPEAVYLLVGPQWGPAVEPVRWLTLYAGVHTLIALTGQMLVALRRARFIMNLSLVALFLLPLSFVVGAQRGIDGVALCWLMTSPVVMIPYLWVTTRSLSIGFRQLGNVMLPSAVGCALMTGGIAAARVVIDPLKWNPALVVGTLVTLGAVVYLLTVLGLFRSRWLRYIRFAKELKHGRSAPSAEA